jgi:hypothetical protein
VKNQPTELPPVAVISAGDARVWGNFHTNVILFIWWSITVT